MKAVFRVFPVVAATSVQHSTTLEVTVSGGPLRRALRKVPGIGTWAAATLLYAVTAITRKVVSVFGVSGTISEQSELDYWNYGALAQRLPE